MKDHRPFRPELRIGSTRSFSPRIAHREYAVLFAPNCASGVRGPFRPELRIGSTRSFSPRIAHREYAVLFAPNCASGVRGPFRFAQEDWLRAKKVGNNKSHRSYFALILSFVMSIAFSGQTLTQRRQLVPRHFWLSYFAVLIPSVSVISRAFSGHSSMHFWQ